MFALVSSKVRVAWVHCSSLLIALLGDCYVVSHLHIARPLMYSWVDEWLNKW